LTGPNNLFLPLPIKKNCSSIKEFPRGKVVPPKCGYTVKKVAHFPLPSRDVTNQTLPGRELFNYSRLGRVLVSDIPARDRKIDNIFLQCIFLELWFWKRLQVNGAEL
jgi:hypothetical protein